MAAPSKFQVDRYVVDTLMRDLVGHDRRPSGFLVYLAIAAAAGQGSAALSHAQIAERTGLSRRAVQAAVAALAKRHLLRVSREGPTDVAVYRVLTPWNRARPTA